MKKYFYEVDLKYSPKILEVPDENNLNQKIKKIYHKLLLKMDK